MLNDFACHFDKEKLVQKGGGGGGGILSEECNISLGSSRKTQINRVLEIKFSLIISFVEVLFNVVLITASYFVKGKKHRMS